MVPSILEGDRIFVNKLAYDLKVPLTTQALATWADPARGDIVVFYSPADGTRLVKRVVGLPGDRIAMEQGRLVVNGHAATYALIEQGAMDLLALETLGRKEHPVRYTRNGPLPHSFDPLEVPEGHYFMMGDNRDHSADSRVFGTVPRSRILGRAPAVVMSFDHDRYYLPRRERWFKRLP
jgi:signal peptidase I